MDIRILGLGNVLMGDDGLGPHVVRTLEATYAFPPGVTLIDAGTPGLDLLPFLIDADVVIIVDTIRAEAPAGTVKEYDRDQLLKHLPLSRVSPHDPGVKQTVLALEFSGRAPKEILVLGVVPERIEPGTELSAPVRRAAAVIADRVRCRLEDLGLPPVLNPRSTPPDIWWESPRRPPAPGHTRSATSS